MAVQRRVILALVCSVLGAAPAWATLDNFKRFKEAYPGKAATAYSCKVCHLGALGRKGDLNPYGLSLQKRKAPADAKKLTTEDLRTVEAEDADGDGASNLDEITAGTAPGDAASVPASVPAASEHN